MTTEERIRKRKIGVIGMGRSGIAAAVLAADYGGKPFVSDSNQAEQLVPAIDTLKQHSIPYETGGHSDRLLESDYIVVSPGVSPLIDILQEVASKGIPIFSEIEFASWVCRGRIVAVTGSNGKTTTTTLIGEILSASGLETYVCGNIGLPFAQVANKVGEQAVAVVEVSTFQLERVADFKPYIALILNLSPDHLDRHGSFLQYKKLKYRITENQAAEDFLILNSDDDEIISDDVTSSAAKLFFTIEGTTDSGVFVEDGVLYTIYRSRKSRIIDSSDILIPGLHNFQNAAAATAAAMMFNIQPDTIENVLKTFPGVEHRLERVDRVAGIEFINDSKATNINSVCWALQSIETPIYLIAGGREKGGSFQPLVKCGRNRIKGLVLVGEAKGKMFDALGKDFPTVFADSLEEAVTKSFELARPGETVLLSPGCASFDMFENFEHRGRVFKAAVDGLKFGNRKNETISD
ncbi:MAG: UDP-N-acetylmuramoyl-L-alanine--D-glutamate ligase [candidate division Zixibacteria bacterium]|nr:UDP-N-acetylmuramoyl-L-alanine--D-glutamate ligase [candidate division Zixibacteria bacterium]